MNTRHALLLASAGGAAAFFVERFIHKRLQSPAKERESLRTATKQLQHRNDQLTALYNVFSEITESLSLRYVVSSTLRETNNLMESDMTVLRVLRGEDLISVGALAGNGQEIGHLPPVKLGEGPSGRAAKRGRLVKLDTDAELAMKPALDTGFSPAQQTGGPTLESGLVMPLIVGARVVGTLSCWSRKKYAYDADAERILEMMASQVATAVVAAEALETSERQARHDALTDLPNRHQLNEDLNGELAHLVESGRHAVVAMVDIDHFKVFNDDFGHRVGDVTLQKVASVLRHSVREKDRVYRYGGEEFVIVFVDVGPDEAMSFAERVRRAVESTPHSGDELQPVGPVTISVGLAALRHHAEDFSRLIEMADGAMYEAKQGGRNRVVMWQEPPPLDATSPETALESKPKRVRRTRKAAA